MNPTAAISSAEAASARICSTSNDGTATDGRPCGIAPTTATFDVASNPKMPATSVGRDDDQERPGLGDRPRRALGHAEPPEQARQRLAHGEQEDEADQRHDDRHEIARRRGVDQGDDRLVDAPAARYRHAEQMLEPG